MDENSKTIYYAELKSNLNLDTEICKSTSDKCVQILAELISEYPEYTVKMFLLGVRYYEASIIPKNILKKYSSITNNVVGINEYLTELNANVLFTEEKYKELINHLAKCMFS